MKGPSSNQTDPALGVNALPHTGLRVPGVNMFPPQVKGDCFAGLHSTPGSGGSLCSSWLMARCSNGPATSLWRGSLVVPSSELSIWKILWPPSLSFLI